MIELRYTNKNIGGEMTGNKVSGNIFKNLFGTISSKMFQEGKEEYRCVFIHNNSLTKEIKNVSLYTKTLFKHLSDNIGFDPINLYQSPPVIGDRYIVPIGATGLWQNMDGFIAEFNGIDWSFSFQPLFKFEYAIEEVSNNAQLINDIYEQPNNLDFVNYDSEDETGLILNIGNIDANSQIALWIKRIVEPKVFRKLDFDVAKIPMQKPFSLNQKVDLIFNFDEMNSFKINYSGANTFIIDDVNTINLSVLLDELGEMDYTNLQFKFSCLFQGEIDNTKVDCDANFMTIDYANIESLIEFGDFSTNSLYLPAPFNEPLVLACKFLDSGVYQLIFELQDKTNSNHTIYSKTLDFNVNEA